MKLRIRILPIIGLLLLMILYAPASVPGTAPCSQLASGAKYGLLGFLVPTVTAGTSSPTPGNWVNVNVFGTSGNLTRSAIVKFTTSSTPDFTMSVSPNPQTIQPGATATYTILMTSINGFSGTVSLQTPLMP